MSEHQLVIERLPEATRSKLRSTQILTSLPQIVSELLQNSLDANATHVDVGINCKDWACWVRDDGDGISKEGLVKIGQGEGGGRYNTSKSYAPGFVNSASTFGFRGEALASAADISCLEICSRTSRSRNTCSIILKGGKQLYEGLAVRWKRESPGTAVCVRDAFYNLPVRRRSHPSPSRTWELVRKEIETYALMFPFVAFTLEDAGRSGDTSHQKDRIHRIPQTASTIDSFRHLFGNAMTEHIEEIDFRSDSIRVEGFISLTGASSRIYQFLYINRHPVTMSDFGRLIDSEFASSSFGKNALDEEGEKNLPRSTIRRSPRKNEKKAVYVLNMSITPEEIDNCLEPRKNAVQIRDDSTAISCLTTVIRTFLQKHGFHHHDTEAPERLTHAPSPRKRRKPAFSSLDDSGYAEEDSIAGILALSFDDEEQATPLVTSSPLFTSLQGPAEEIVWLDPTTGERFLVDPRTGHSFRQTEHSAHQAENENPLLTGIDRGEGRRTLRQHAADKLAGLASFNPSRSDIPEWLGRALQSNQAYATTENRIPSVKIPPALGHSASRYHQSEDDCPRPQNNALSEGFRISAIGSGYSSWSDSFTKEDLNNAKVINQVDRKFIACRIMKRSSASAESRGDAASHQEDILVFVDQHAADERVRVEYFLKELCMGFLGSQAETKDESVRGVRVRELTPPQPVLLTQHEAHSIMGSQDVRELLRKWGIRFMELSNNVPVSDAPSDSGRSIGYLQLLVSSIPEIVGDKLLQGDELRDFVKGILGQIQSGELLSDSRSNSLLENDEDEFFWLKAVRRCPRGLLELVSSKACRGAIMFNDSLSLAQCERLIQQLSETAFPFQCAHGRPSLVPLIETGALRRNSQESRKSWNNWSRLETMEAV